MPKSNSNYHPQQKVIDIKNIAQQNDTLAIVERDAMVGVSSMNVDGEERDLGIVKNFRDNHILGRLLPKHFSISWAHLDPGQKLDSHRHPVSSVIVAMEGSGSSQGDSALDFKAGDTIIVPPWNEHGFTGGDAKGLWALSIQFSDIAIFEKKVNPLTSFNEKNTNLPPISDRQLVVLNRQSQVSKNLQGVIEHTHIPTTVKFKWHEIDENHEINSIDSTHVRLIIASEGEGSVTTNDGFQTKIKKGMAFWQNQSLSLSSSDKSPLWLLTIDIKR